ncbi:unnamed protein product [Symbiodinium sp. CCMP2456]|nr:unnamed protein product [Symbiodinium sp. CCMP2456]
MAVAELDVVQSVCNQLPHMMCTFNDSCVILQWLEYATATILTSVLFLDAGSAGSESRSIWPLATVVYRAARFQLGKHGHCLLRWMNPLLQYQRSEFCTEDVHQNGAIANFDEKESFIHRPQIGMRRSDVCAQEVAWLEAKQIGKIALKYPYGLVEMRFHLHALTLAFIVMLCIFEPLAKLFFTLGSTDHANKRDQRGRQPKVTRVHYPYDRRWEKAVDPAYHYVMQSLHNCTASNWCLIISTVRRSGANAVSQFFELCRWVYSNNSTSAQKLIFAMNEEELKDAIINVPPFEEGMRAREAALEPWFPGINLSENIMITSNGSTHPWPMHYSKMMSYFRNESRWPTDLAEELRRQDMMVLFYPDGRLF